MTLNPQGHGLVPGRLSNDEPERQTYGFTQTYSFLRKPVAAHRHFTLQYLTKRQAFCLFVKQKA